MEVCILYRAHITAIYVCVRTRACMHLRGWKCWPCERRHGFAGLSERSLSRSERCWPLGNKLVVATTQQRIIYVLTGVALSRTHRDGSRTRASTNRAFCRAYAKQWILGYRRASAHVRSTGYRCWDHEERIPSSDDSLRSLSHGSDELMTNICTLAYSRNVNKVVSMDARW